LCFNRTFRQASFQSRPIAVVGSCGRGRFALFGGPHAFETGPFGLLHQPHNSRFLQNLLTWLLEVPSSTTEAAGLSVVEPQFQLWQQAQDRWRDLCRLEDHSPDDPLHSSVERLLRDTDTFTALSSARWTP
jgi:hypothetical protein